MNIDHKRLRAAHKPTCEFPKGTFDRTDYSEQRVREMTREEVVEVIRTLYYHPGLDNPDKGNGRLVFLLETHITGLTRKLNELSK